LQALLVACALALVPYVAIRGSVTRMIAARNRHRDHQ
jgi:hypothetical protein